MSPLAVLAMLWAAATWALGSVFFSRALGAPGGPTPAAANTLKNCLALAMFVALLPLTGGAWPEPRAAALLVASGVLGFAFGDSLYFGAITRCGIQLASTVALLFVPLAAVLGWLVYGELMSAPQVLGLVVALLGVGVVVTDGAAVAGGAALDPVRKREGVLLSFGVVVVIALAVTIGAGESDACGVLPMATLRMSGGVLGAFPIALALATRSGDVRRELRDVTAAVRTRRARPRPLWVALTLALAGLVPYHFAMRDLPVGVAAILSATTPLFALLFGRLSGERVGPRGLAGMLVGFGGVALIVLSG